MKLIALKDFLRVPDLEKFEIPPGQHPGQVDKGTQFSIGGDLPLSKLEKQEKRLAAQLIISGSVAEPTPAIIERLAAEKERERSRLANHVKISVAGANAAIAAQYRELLHMLQSSVDK